MKKNLRISEKMYFSYLRFAPNDLLLRRLCIPQGNSGTRIFIKIANKFAYPKNSSYLFSAIDNKKLNKHSYGRFFNQEYGRDCSLSD